MKNTGRVQQLVMIAAVVVVVYLLFNCMDKSEYSVKEYAAFAPAAGPGMGPAADAAPGMKQEVHHNHNGRDHYKLLNTTSILHRLLYMFNNFFFTRQRHILLGKYRGLVHRGSGPGRDSKKTQKPFWQTRFQRIRE